MDNSSDEDDEDDEEDVLINSFLGKYVTKQKFRYAKLQFR